LFAAMVAQCISSAAKSTSPILDIISWPILVTTMYCRPLFLLLLLAIGVVFERWLMKVVLMLNPRPSHNCTISMRLSHMCSHWLLLSYFIQHSLAQGV
jgi:hypothetical protein